MMMMMKEKDEHTHRHILFELKLFDDQHSASDFIHFDMMIIFRNLKFSMIINKKMTRFYKTID